MLNKEAIEKLQEANCVEHLNTEIAGAKLERPALALPSEMRVVDLERYLPAPVRKRGTMTTESLNGFTRYTEENKSEQTVCFVDQREMVACAIIDHGTTAAPAHNEHRACLSLERTSDYQDLLVANKSRMTQREMAEWIEEHVDSLRFFTTLDGDTEISASRAISAIRKVKDQQRTESEKTVGSFSETRGVLASASLESEDLPGFVCMTIEPYAELKERRFIMRLSYHRDREGFSLRVIRLDQHKEEMAKEFADLVEHRLGDIPVFVGEFRKQ